MTMVQLVLVAAMGIFSSPPPADWLWVPPTLFPVDTDTRTLIPGRKAHLSLPSSAEVRNAWSCTSNTYNLTTICYV